jgi:uncharacterized membrane protein YkoI
VLFATSLAAESEKKISKSDLPPAVLKAANEISQGATVKGYSEDRENGKLEYEIEMVVNGRSRDVTISRDGQVLEIEEQVDLSSLSPGVQEALKKKASKGVITKVESLTKRGKLVAYEAQVRTAGKHSEVQVGPDGQTLDHEE